MNRVKRTSDTLLFDFFLVFNSRRFCCSVLRYTTAPCGPSLTSVTHSSPPTRARSSPCRLKPTWPLPPSPGKNGGYFTLHSRSLYWIRCAGHSRAAEPCIFCLVVYKLQLIFIHFLVLPHCFVRSPLIYKPSPSGTAPTERTNNNDNKPKNYNSTSGSGRYNEV